MELPPLRERPEDIEVLIEHFLDRLAERGEERKQISPRARAVLLGHDWPGNVRQLRNTLERAAILGSGTILDVADLPEALAGAETPEVRTPIVSLAEMEKAHILRVLEHCGGNKKASAEVLGIDRSTLYAKLRQYGTI
ncbi:MAG: helix-turn-helix domain-containing protein, partial [Planctomycetota bacterium]